MCLKNMRTNKLTITTSRRNARLARATKGLTYGTPEHRLAYNQEIARLCADANLAQTTRRGGRGKVAGEL
jgi:hypothetical protein